MKGDKLIVPAVRDSLSTISDYVKEIAQQAGLGGKKSQNLRRAVDEIATNIIEHGYVHKKGQEFLELEAQFDRSVLIISLEDTGIPFNPIKHPTPNNFNKPLEDREIGGLGVYLAQISVDELIYERIGHRNCNRLIVYMKQN